MFTLRLFPKQPTIKFDRQLPISNWAYPFHRHADLNADRLAPYSSPSRTQIRRRAIYIHIPLCETICNFCPFRRDKYKSASALDEYITALVTEIDLKRHFLGRCKVDAIFVGGGTPSLLSARQIELLGEALVRNFDLGALSEFTFEVEVKSVSHEKVEAMHDIGVNRISFGAQTFSEEYRALFSLVVFFPYRGVLKKSRVAWGEVPDDTLISLRQALDAELMVDSGDRYEVTRTGWLFYVNLMYYLMPEPGKRWISNLIERQQQLGRSLESTDLTELIYSTVGI